MAYGIFGGLAEGFGAGANLRMKQDALEDEKKTNQLRRDNFELEIRKKKGELEDADKKRTIDDYFADQAERIRKGAAAGNLDDFTFTPFDEFRASRKPKEQPKQPEPQPTGIAGILAGLRGGIAPAPAAEPAGIAAPAGDAPPAPQGAGIQSPAPAPKEPVENPWTPVGSKDPNVMEKSIRLRADLLKQYYTMRGEHDKADKVDGTMTGMLQKNWEERIRLPLLGMWNGSRDGVRKLNEAHGLIPDGFSIDPESGVYDKKDKVWKGMTVTNEATGQRETVDITREMLIGWSRRYDLLGATKEIIDSESKRASEDRAERGVVVQEGTLGVNQMNARTNARNAATQAAREDRIAQDGARAQDDLNTARIGKLKFPRAGTEITLDDRQNFTGKNKDERDVEEARLRAEIARQTNGLRIFDAVAGLNPRVNRSTLAAFAQASASGKFKEQTPKMDGERRYVTFAGQKIYLD